MAYKVLVVDDEEWVCKLVDGYLRQAGFEVITAGDGRMAIARFERHRPDLVILDWMLPGIDGIEVARRIRATSSVPIIMLTARAEEEDRIKGLEFGADDYVVKPFSARELEARVRAVLRRANGRERTVLEEGDIRIDLPRREVRVAGRTIDGLTPMEFDLLAFLLSHPGRVFTRLEILEVLRGTRYASFERAVDSQIKRLRRKVEPDPGNPRYIVTVFGIGYKLVPDGERR